MSPTLSQHLALERCPHCSVDKPNLTRKWETVTTDSSGDYKRFWRVYECGRCGGLVVAGTAFGFESPVEECYPESKAVDQAIPTRAKEYLSQALNARHTPAGAVMLAASAVDAMLKTKGLKEGSLFARIDQAATSHLITPEMAQWAHDVRLDANDQRHSDEAAALPTAKDADRAIDFASALAQFMFVLPTLVQRGLKAAKSP